MTGCNKENIYLSLCVTKYCLDFYTNHIYNINEDAYYVAQVEVFYLS